MRNDVDLTAESEREPAPVVAPEPPPAPLLVLLASDGDALCTDELCLPADATAARPTGGHEAGA